MKIAITKLAINLIRDRGLNPARDQRGWSPPLETPFNCSRLKRRGLLRINSLRAWLLGANICKGDRPVAPPRNTIVNAGMKITSCETSD